MKKIISTLQALMLLSVLTVQAQSQTFDLFNGGHQDAPVNISIGYVNKDWVTEFSADDKYHENLWGEQGKHLHGVQVGMAFNPCMKAGLGIHTGIYYEGYISMSDAVRQSYGYDQYTEHSLYAPLHAMWRIPLGTESSLSLFGGIGMNYAMYGTFRDNDYVYDFWSEEFVNVGDWEYTFDYGRNDWPKAFNASYEFGASLRLKDVVLSFTYSDGITDHQFYRKDGPYKTKQQKLAFSLGFAIEL